MAMSFACLRSLSAYRNKNQQFMSLWMNLSTQPAFSCLVWPIHRAVIQLF